MGDIFREIDEELRQDRYERLWQSYGKYAIGIGMALVAAVIGWKAWQHYTITRIKRCAYGVLFYTVR